MGKPRTVQATRNEPQDPSVDQSIQETSVVDDKEVEVRTMIPKEHAGSSRKQSDDGRSDPRSDPFSVASAKNAEPTSRCPYCKAEVQDDARKCPHCHEYIDLRYSNIDEGTYRFARMVELERIKADVRHWFRHVVIGGSIIGIACACFLLFGFHDMIGRLVKKAIDDEFAGQVDNLSERLALVPNIPPQLEGLNERMDKLNDTIQSTQARSQEVYLIQLVRLRAQLEKLVMRAASQQTLTSDPLWLQQPSTTQGELPTVVYGPMDKPIRFSWTPPEVLAARTTLVYRLEVSQQPLFSSSAAVASWETPFITQPVTPLQISHALGTSVQGLLYWRVVARAQSSDEELRSSSIGAFEYFENACERLKQIGRVRVGITASEAMPFAHSADGTRLTGFDIELARKITEHLPIALDTQERIDVEFRMYNWLNLLLSPSQNEVDFIIGSITKKKERESLYDIAFTNPYYRTEQALVLLKGTTHTLTSLSVLKEMTVAAQEGTTGYFAAQQHVPHDKLMRTGSIEAGLSLVLNGDVNAVIADLEIAAEQAEKSSELAVVSISQIGARIGSHPEFFDEYGIAVAKEQQELLEALNRCLFGPAERLRQKYSGAFTEPEE